MERKDDFYYIELKDGRHYVVDQDLWSQFLAFASGNHSVASNLLAPDGTELLYPDGSTISITVDNAFSYSDEEKLDSISLSEFSELQKKVSWMNWRLTELELAVSKNSNSIDSLNSNKATVSSLDSSVARIKQLEDEAKSNLQYK